MSKTAWIVLALVLLALGVGSFFLEGISYVTQETVVDAGPLEVTAEQEERVGFPVWVSFALSAAGVLALAVGLTRSGPE